MQLTLLVGNTLFEEVMHPVPVVARAIEVLAAVVHQYAAIEGDDKPFVTIPVDGNLEQVGYRGCRKVAHGAVGFAYGNGGCGIEI
jgi:hypothetical protein